MRRRPCLWRRRRRPAGPGCWRRPSAGSPGRTAGTSHAAVRRRRVGPRGRATARACSTAMTATTTPKSVFRTSLTVVATSLGLGAVGDPDRHDLGGVVDGRARPGAEELLAHVDGVADQGVGSTASIPNRVLTAIGDRDLLVPRLDGWSGGDDRGVAAHRNPDAQEGRGRVDAVPVSRPRTWATPSAVDIRPAPSPVPAGRWRRPRRGRGGHREGRWRSAAPVSRPGASPRASPGISRELADRHPEDDRDDHFADRVSQGFRQNPWTTGREPTAKPGEGRSAASVRGLGRDGGRRHRRTPANSCCRLPAEIRAHSSAVRPGTAWSSRQRVGVAHLERVVAAEHHPVGADDVEEEPQRAGEWSTVSWCTGDSHSLGARVRRGGGTAGVAGEAVVPAARTGTARSRRRGPGRPAGRGGGPGRRRRSGGRARWSTRPGCRPGCRGSSATRRGRPATRTGGSATGQRSSSAARPERFEVGVVELAAVDGGGDLDADHARARLTACRNSSAAACRSCSGTVHSAAEAVGVLGRRSRPAAR